MSGIEVQVHMLFQIGGGHCQGWHPGVCEWPGQTTIPGKRADGIGYGWIPVDQSSWPCKWTIAHLHVSRAFDPFLRGKMHYISYIGVGTLGWAPSPPLPTVILWGKPTGKGCLVRSKHGCEDPKEIGFNTRNWIDSVHDRAPVREILSVYSYWWNSTLGVATCLFTLYYKINFSYHFFLLLLEFLSFFLAPCHFLLFSCFPPFFTQKSRAVSHLSCFSPDKQQNELHNQYRETRACCQHDSRKVPDRQHFIHINKVNELQILRKQILDKNVAFYHK